MGCSMWDSMCASTMLLHLFALGFQGHVLKVKRQKQNMRTIACFVSCVFLVLFCGGPTSMGICVLTIKRSFAGGFSFKMLDAFFAKKTPRHGRRPIGTLVPWRARHEDAPTGVWRQRDRNIAAISETVWMMTSFKAFFFS